MQRLRRHWGPVTVAFFRRPCASCSHVWHVWRCRWLHARKKLGGRWRDTVDKNRGVVVRVSGWWGFYKQECWSRGIFGEERFGRIWIDTFSSACPIEFWHFQDFRREKNPKKHQTKPYDMVFHPWNTRGWNATWWGYWVVCITVEDPEWFATVNVDKSTKLLKTMVLNIYQAF